jgi:hypothetical protein
MKQHRTQARRARLLMGGKDDVTYPHDDEIPTKGEYVGVPSRWVSQFKEWAREDSDRFPGVIPLHELACDTHHRWKYYPTPIAHDPRGDIVGLIIHHSCCFVSIKYMHHCWIICMIWCPCYSVTGIRPGLVTLVKASEFDILQQHPLGFVPGNIKYHTLSMAPLTFSMMMV